MQKLRVDGVDGYMNIYKNSQKLCYEFKAYTVDVYTNKWNIFTYFHTFCLK